jgi:hypothetical protein
MLLVSFETPGSLAATAGDQANQFGKQAPPAAVPRSRLCTAVRWAQSIWRCGRVGRKWTFQKKDAPAMISPGQRSRELN